MLIKKGKYVIGMVDGEFIIVGMAELGEIYQESEAEILRLFDSESDDVKLETYENYKEECIEADGEDSWEEFYNEYYEKYKASI